MNKELYDMLNDFGTIECNIGKEMDKYNITVTKMERLTGLNHDTVKKYYTNEIERMDKVVLAKMINVLVLHGMKPSSLIVYKK